MGRPARRQTTGTQDTQDPPNIEVFVGILLTALGMLLGAIALSHPGYIYSAAGFIVATIATYLLWKKEIVTPVAGRWMIGGFFAATIVFWLLTWTFSQPADSASTLGTEEPSPYSEPSDSASALGTEELGPYIGVPGSPVERFSEFGRVGPLRLSMPRARVEELLGSSPDEESSSALDNTTAAFWHGAVDDLGLRFSSVFSADGTTESVAVTYLNDSSSFGMLDGLTLGEATFGDVVDVLGTPIAGVLDTIEGHTTYEILYQGGPEGTWWVSFGYGAISGGPDDPGVEGLPSVPVSTFSAEYGSQLPCNGVGLGGGVFFEVVRGEGTTCIPVDEQP